MGIVPGMLKWIISFGNIPADRDRLKKWLGTQIQYIKTNGKNTPLSTSSSYIHYDGIFCYQGRLVRRDALVKGLYYSENDELCASTEFADDQKEITELMKSGALSITRYVVIDRLLYDGNNDYLRYDKVASLGEIDYHPTIHLMDLVWTPHNNDLNNL